MACTLQISLKAAEGPDTKANVPCCGTGEGTSDRGGRGAVQGATVVDFAYHVHTDVGNQMYGAKVNGKMVANNHELQNAEVVEILTYSKEISAQDVLRHQVCPGGAACWTNCRVLAEGLHHRPFRPRLQPPCSLCRR